jgi:hypothetical protein
MGIPNGQAQLEPRDAHLFLGSASSSPILATEIAMRGIALFPTWSDVNPMRIDESHNTSGSDHLKYGQRYLMHSLSLESLRPSYYHCLLPPFSPCWA